MEQRQGDLTGPIPVNIPGLPPLFGVSRDGRRFGVPTAPALPLRGAMAGQRPREARTSRTAWPRRPPPRGRAPLRAFPSRGNISSLPDGLHTKNIRPPVAVVKACWLPRGTTASVPGPPLNSASPMRNSYWPSSTSMIFMNPACAWGGLSSMTGWRNANAPSASATSRPRTSTLSQVSGPMSTLVPPSSETAHPSRPHSAIGSSSRPELQPSREYAAIILPGLQALRLASRQGSTDEFRAAERSNRQNNLAGRARRGKRGATWLNGRSRSSPST
jgi:hypothetical protein